MRYKEIIREATEQFWNYIYQRYTELEHQLATDPDATLVQSEDLEKRLLAMVGVDADEQDLIETAIASFQEIIGRAENIIAKRKR